MKKKFKISIVTICIATLSVVMSSYCPPYGQCGGMNWTGSTTCEPGYVCTYINQYYSQCLPIGGDKRCALYCEGRFIGILSNAHTCGTHQDCKFYIEEYFFITCPNGYGSFATGICGNW